MAGLIIAFGMYKHQPTQNMRINFVVSWSLNFQFSFSFKAAQNVLYNQAMHVQGFQRVNTMSIEIPFNCQLVQDHSRANQPIFGGRIG